MTIPSHFPSVTNTHTVPTTNEGKIAFRFISNHHACESEAAKYSTDDWGQIKRIWNQRDFNERNAARAKILAKKAERIELELFAPSGNSIVKKTIATGETTCSEFFTAVQGDPFSETTYRSGTLIELLTLAKPKVAEEVKPLIAWRFGSASSRSGMELVRVSQVSTTQSGKQVARYFSKLDGGLEQLAAQYHTTLATSAQAVERAAVRSLLEIVQFHQKEIANDPLRELRGFREWIRIEIDRVRSEHKVGAVTQTLGVVSAGILSVNPLAGLGCLALVAIGERLFGTPPKEETTTSVMDLPPVQTAAQMATCIKETLVRIPVLDFQGGKPAINFPDSTSIWSGATSGPKGEQVQLFYVPSEKQYFWLIHEKDTDTKVVVKCDAETKAKLERIHASPENRVYLGAMVPKFTLDKDTIEEVKITYRSKWDPKIFISEGTWTMTLLSAKVSSPGSIGSKFGHAMLCFEGVDENGLPFIRYGELTSSGPKLNGEIHVKGTGAVPYFVFESKFPENKLKVRERTPPLVTNAAGGRAVMRQIRTDQNFQSVKLSLYSAVFGSSETAHYCLSYVVTLLRSEFSTVPLPTLTTIDPDEYIRRNKDDYPWKK